jgi:hypothetical protein
VHALSFHPCSPLQKPLDIEAANSDVDGSHVPVLISSQTIVDVFFVVEHFLNGAQKRQSGFVQSL